MESTMFLPLRTNDYAGAHHDGSPEGWGRRDKSQGIVIRPGGNKLVNKAGCDAPHVCHQRRGL